MPEGWLHHLLPCVLYPELHLLTDFPLAALEPGLGIGFVVFWLPS